MRVLHFVAMLCGMLFTIWSFDVSAQAYLSFSKYAGGSGAESSTMQMKVVNGETYIVGGTTSPDFPVTNGSTYKGDRDIVAAKYAANGDLLYATYIGGSGDDAYSVFQLEIVNGEAYIGNATASADYPTTTGRPFGGGRDVAITKLDANGNIAFSTLLGGVGTDYLGSIFSSTGLVIEGNTVFVGGTTESFNFPSSQAGNSFRGVSDAFITTLNATTGALIHSRLIGGSKYDVLRSFEVQSGAVFITMVSASQDIPLTVQPSYTISEFGELYVTKLNTSNLLPVFARFPGPNIVGFGFYIRSQVINGEMHLWGGTSSADFPTTNGTVSTIDLFGTNYTDGFYTRLNADGTIGFSTILTGDGQDQVYLFKYVNGTVYLAGGATNFDTRTVDVNVYKINPNGSFAYSKQLRAGRVIDGNSFFGTSINLEVVGADVFLSGVVYYPEYPVTNNSQFYSSSIYRFGTGYFTHLNANGDIVYSSFLGKMRRQFGLKYTNNKFYLLAESDDNTYPVTDSSTVKGGADNLLIVLNPDGSNYYSSYIGGDSSDIFTSGLEVFNNDLYFSNTTNSLTYPVTENTLYRGNYDRVLTKVSFCPDNYLISNDTLRPAVQTVCKNGLGQKITGQQVSVPADSMPTVYRNGVAEQQRPIGTTYQWQVANSLSGPYNNIPNAVFKDYTPVVGTINQYYRRLAFRLPQCGGTLVHISDTASALVNSLTAPVLNLNGPYITCPGSAITIGGSPTATGGNPPYRSYEWDNNLPAVANPVITTSLNTIYTLLVTDNSGCKQIGQALVNVYRANAGLNKSNCAGNAVKIGGSPVNTPGVLYNWQPATDLTSTTTAQPYANPPAAAQYILTLTVPKTGGGTCVTKDTTVVTPAAAPLTSGFAGPDRVTCFGDTTYIGTSPEPGYKYIWSPGSYLTRNDSSETKYYPGNILMPYPNPAFINLTAQKEGCFFADQAEVAYIESRAGLSFCGPRLVGLPDRTPNIDETYTWSLVSGPGNFSGPTNLPQVPVSASVGAASVYGLTVSYRGRSCYSEVIVPPTCGNCGMQFEVYAKYVCPSFDVNFGDVAINVLTGVRNPIFSWAPQQGLSNYNTATVRLTDNVPRTYFVTITSADDPAITCTDSIKVNDPAFSRPIFEVRDTATCVNQPVTIGATTVAGYTYTWDATVPGLSDYTASNPVATIAFNSSFPVVATDGNGCLIKDTVNVNVEMINAAAGDDWLICSNGVVKLGTIPLPGTSYVWEPQVSPWQNGTNQFSAQPEVLVATDITFHVTATTPIGCVIEDSVNVFINSSPTISDAPDVTACKGALTAIGLPALPGVTYQWSPNTGLDNPGLAQPTFIAENNITYTVQAFFPGNCALPATDQVTVTVNDPAFSMADISFCPGNNSVQLGNDAPAGMAQYSWQPAFSLTNPLIANPLTTFLYPLASSTFILSVETPDGCSASDTIVLTPAISPANAGTDVSLCKNTSRQIGDAGNQTGPGISYSWSPATGLSSTTSTSPVFTGTAVGTFTYYLTKTSSNPACSSVDSTVITVEELVLPVLDAPSVCRNSCVQIGPAPVSNVQYQWSPATGLSNANTANPFACTDSTNITYQLTAVTSSGCRASGTVLITVNSAAAAQINIPSLTACVGDTGLRFQPFINPPVGPYLFEWSPNDGTLSNINLLNPAVFITGTGSKQYTLLVTDSITGCSNSATGNLLVNNCTATASIGDFMWFDTNGDGLQNNGEIGVGNMSVKLHNSSGFNVATVVTNANGYYSFAGITPGNGYYVVFDKPAGYSFTTQNVGGIAALDNSKADNIGRSNAFNITSGATILSIDAGIKPSGTTPVVLLSFTGALQSNKTVLLNWQTTAEYNNRYFDVERSSDGINFMAIGRVNGNGTTVLPHSYSLMDAHPLNGTNYYRLKQVDHDGRFVYSRIVLLRISNSPVVKAFYNNQSNSISIIFNALQKSTQLTLFASNGQLVKSASVINRNNYLLELPVVASGVYMLQLVTGNGIYTEKVFIGN